MLDFFPSVDSYFGVYCLNIESLKNREDRRHYSLRQIVFCRAHFNNIPLFITASLGDNDPSI
jgi:hypothetical protein